MADAKLPQNVTPTQRAAFDALLACGQEHLFASWPPGSANAADKLRFLDQAAKLDKNYPGGVGAYVAKARDMLAASKEGVNPFDKYWPEMPDTEALHFASENYYTAERKGLAEAAQACFVLVAGGLGERLGFSGIKVALPHETTTGTCFLELYARHILAIEAAAAKAGPATEALRAGSPRPAAGGGARPAVPLAIMTSGDTHTRTLALLEANDFFGLRRDQVTLMQQEKVPALVDAEGRMCAAGADDPYTILTKPHGHGDVHLLLHQTGLAARWKAEGRKWVCFLQDTNAPVFRTLLPAIGVSAQKGFEVNSVCVPRRAKAAVGAIMKLVERDDRSKSITVNVEYNYIDSVLRATVNKEGDVAGPDGWSMFPGNVNQLVFALGPYADTVARTGGIVPEFVNPKYADAARTTFKKPTRIESLMQDYPKSLSGRDPPASVGVTVFHDLEYAEHAFAPNRFYAPVKNNVVDAAKKFDAGIPDAGAASGEMNVYMLACGTLKAAGADVGRPRERSVNGIKVLQPPRVVFSPSFAPTLEVARTRFATPGRVSITSRSTLVLDGAGIRVKRLSLDGALVVRACEGAFVELTSVEVENGGWEFVPLREGEDLGDDARAAEVLRLRGYRLVKHQTRELVFDKPGYYEVRFSEYARVPVNKMMVVAAAKMVGHAKKAKERVSLLKSNRKSCHL